MSIATQKVIASRIATATGHSPIAVLATHARGVDGQPLFHAVFAATVGGQRVIRDAGPRLIGIFAGQTGASVFLDSSLCQQQIPDTNESNINAGAIQ